LFSIKPGRLLDAEAPTEGVSAFELYGCLFFGAVGKIEELPDGLPPETRAVVLDMQRLVLVDSSGLDALEQMYRTLQRRGIALMLTNVNDQPLQLMRSTGFEALLGRENITCHSADRIDPDAAGP
jgi:SulP family sulfate permease